MFAAMCVLLHHARDGNMSKIVFQVAMLLRRHCRLFLEVNVAKVSRDGVHLLYMKRTTKAAADGSSGSRREEVLGERDGLVFDCVDGDGVV